MIRTTTFDDLIDQLEEEARRRGFEAVRHEPGVNLAELRLFKPEPPDLRDVGTITIRRDFEIAIRTPNGRRSAVGLRIPADVQLGNPYPTPFEVNPEAVFRLIERVESRRVFPGGRTALAEHVLERVRNRGIRNAFISTSLEGKPILSHVVLSSLVSIDFRPGTAVVLLGDRVESRFDIVGITTAQVADLVTIGVTLAEENGNDGSPFTGPIDFTSSVEDAIRDGWNGEPAPDGPLRSGRRVLVDGDHEAYFHHRRGAWYRDVSVVVRADRIEIKRLVSEGGLEEVSVPIVTAETGDRLANRVEVVRIVRAWLELDEGERVAATLGLDVPDDNPDEVLGEEPSTDSPDTAPRERNDSAFGRAVRDRIERGE